MLPRRVIGMGGTVFGDIQLGVWGPGGMPRVPPKVASVVPRWRGAGSTTTMSTATVARLGSECRARYPRHEHGDHRRLDGESKCAPDHSSPAHTLHLPFVVPSWSATDAIRARKRTYSGHTSFGKHRRASRLACMPSMKAGLALARGGLTYEGS